jgi:iron complex transport system permease protein
MIRPPTQDISRPPARVPSRSGTALRFALLISALAAVLCLNLGFGSSDIGIGEIADILFRPASADGHSSSFVIVRSIRLPRLLSAAMSGAALAVAGLLLQAFFANPVVEPYVLGVSSGAMLFVGLAVLGGSRLGISRLPPEALAAGAFAGAMLVMALVLFAARRVRSVITLLLIGLMFGYLCSAGTGILSAFAEKEQIARFSVWAMGNFSGLGWRQTRVIAAVVLPGTFLSFLLAKPLNALSMGESYAASMGVSIKRLRLAIILLSSVLTAAVTAFAGPVSFIGLAVPHLCRVLFRGSDARVLIPASVIGGALMAALADFAARSVASPIELPLGAVTAIVGAPLVVALLWKDGFGRRL